MNPVTLEAPKERDWTRIRAAMLLGCALATLCFVALAFDQDSGISVSWAYCGSFIVAGVGFSAIVFLRYRFRFALVAGAGFLAGMLLLHYCDTTPAKPLRRLEAAVQAGMTVAEVRSAVQREFPEQGRFPVPVVFESAPDSGIGQMALFPDAGSSSSIFLTFSNGRVTDKQSSLRLTPFSDWAIIKVVAFACACFCCICWPSVRRLFGVNPWTGHGIDLRSVAERLQRVRRDHLGDCRTRHNAAWQRRSLLASAGLALRRFPYFRVRVAENSQNPKTDEAEKA